MIVNIREWVADNIGYRFSGCFYSKFHDHIFEFIKSKIPREYIGKNIADLGCGDGSNTLRIKKIFKAKNIIGYDRNEHLLKRAKEKGLNVRKKDLNREIPKGNLAVFTFSLHHLKR